jgi:hypothetical protein
MQQKRPKPRGAAAFMLGGVPDAPPNLTVEAHMARRIRFALSLLLVSFAFATAACADATAPTPSADLVCDQNNPNVCK